MSEKEIKSAAELLKQATGIEFFGHPLFYEYLIEMAKLHSVKNHDYAGSGDPLGNFRRVASMVKPLLNPAIPDSLKPVAIALIYGAKQYDAVLDMLGNNRVPKVEGLDPRMQDVSIYAVLSRILIKEGNPLIPIQLDWGRLGCTRCGCVTHFTTEMDFNEAFSKHGVDYVCSRCRLKKDKK